MNQPKRILIVDDEELNQELLEGIVATLGHETEIVRDGVEALAMIKPDIPLYGRICAVADVFDALTSKRPYKKAFSNEKTFEILREGRGTQFDPKVLDTFFDRLNEVMAIQEQYSDNMEVASTLYP